MNPNLHQLWVAPFYAAIAALLVLWGLYILALPDPTPQEVNGTDLYKGDEWAN